MTASERRRKGWELRDESERERDSALSSGLWTAWGGSVSRM